MLQNVVQQTIQRIVIPAFLKLITPEMFYQIASDLGWSLAKATKFTKIDDNFMKQVDKHWRIERK